MSRWPWNRDSRLRGGTVVVVAGVDVAVDDDDGAQRNRCSPPRVTRYLPATLATGSRIRNPRTRTDRFFR